jgi:hypothetical protein
VVPLNNQTECLAKNARTKLAMSKQTRASAGADIFISESPGLLAELATPVIELIAIRILELARAGEFDPDKMTETILAEFEP